jgi:hypothetical protein
MGRSKESREIVSQTILDILHNDGPQTKKKLIKKQKLTVIKANHDDTDIIMKTKKKITRKALKSLLKSGKIEQNGKEYKIVAVKHDSSTTDKSTTNNNSASDDTLIPIGMKLRQKESTTTTHDDDEDIPLKKKLVQFQDREEGEPPLTISSNDIDEEIRRLEQELAAADDDDSDDDDSDSESVVGSSGEHINDDQMPTIPQQDQPAVLSLSKFANDRVEHLPPTYLPEPGRYKNSDGIGPKKKKSKKNTETNNQGDRPKSISGLEQAVKEVLNGYTARSSEKIPYYCRFCSKQYDNEIEFFQHKESEFHKTAVAVERKATYCRLCRIQLTSPIQMKEHLQSKPHKERLHKVSGRSSSSGGRGGRGERRIVGGGGGGGRGRQQHRSRPYSS